MSILMVYDAADLEEKTKNLKLSTKQQTLGNIRSNRYLEE